MGELARTKRCSKCWTMKSGLEMRVQRGAPDGLSSWCIDCHNGAKRAGNLARYHQAQAFLETLKKDPCQDCGRQVAWSKVLVEVTKCDLVCANCHRLRTDVRRKEAA